MSARAATRGGVLLHLAGVLLALVLLRAAWLDDRSVHDRNGMLLKELGDVHDKARNHDALVAQLAAMRPMLAAVTTRLPARIDGGAIEQALRSNAQAHAVAVTDIAWKAEYIHEGFYADRTAVFALQGAASDVAAFVQTLLRDAPIANIAAMTLAPGDAPHTLRVDLRVAYFHAIEEEP